MLEATGKVQRDKVQREQANELNPAEPCRACYGKLWLECALKVLQLNNIDQFAFASTMRDCVLLGRGKHRNAILRGLTNCA